MKNNLKIAIYSGDIPSTTFIERLILGLANKGCHILLFGLKKERIKYGNNVEIKAYNKRRISKGLFLLRYSLLLSLFRNKEKRKLDTLLKKQSKTSLYDKVKYYPVLWYKPDIFHMQWAKGLSDWIWVKEFGMRLVVSLRGAHINYSPIADLELANMYRENFPKVDAFHAVSKAIGYEAEKYGASKERINVIYSGLNLEGDSAINNPQNDLIKLISVGRPHWKKGYSYALDACKILKDNNVQFKYVIVGAANDIELAYQIYDLKLEDEVELIKNIPFEFVKEQIQSSDLLVLPSVEEGIANVVLEAMALETLVLTTDCGGMNEVIKDNENGFIVTIRDSEKMAQKIMDIAKGNNEQKREILDKALITIKDQHSENQMVDGMLTLYKSL